MSDQCNPQTQNVKFKLTSSDRIHNPAVSYKNISDKNQSKFKVLLKQSLEHS